eukprot:193155-Pelagomonas_calceolata.AAC.3
MPIRPPAAAAGLSVYALERALNCLSLTQQSEDCYPPGSCSEGCSTGFCVVSSCEQLVKLVCQNADLSCAQQTAAGHGFPWLEG